MKTIRKIISEHKKIAAAVIGLCIVSSASLIVYSWFDFGKKLETVTVVQKPTMLVLTSGNTEDIERFYLGDIDAEEGTSKDYVFGVYSDVKVDYKIELAYTQNIAFKSYDVFSAGETEKAEEGSVLYITESGDEQYYQRGEKVGFEEYEDTDDLTYEGYENVHKKSRPRYFIQKEAVIHSDDTDTDKGFTDYYILNINWEGTGIQNDKETDMIYIIVSSEYNENESAGN